jgi:hypothetical protein
MTPATTWSTLAMRTAARTGFLRHSLGDLLDGGTSVVPDRPGQYVGLNLNLKFVKGDGGASSFCRCSNVKLEFV